jgi:phage-related tail protein
VQRKGRDIIQIMLTKNDLREIKKIVDTSIKPLDDKIDTLAIATKKQFDEVGNRLDDIENNSETTNNRLGIIEKDVKDIKRMQYSHETRLLKLEM